MGVGNYSHLPFNMKNFSIIEIDKYLQRHNVPGSIIYLQTKGTEMGKYNKVSVKSVNSRSGNEVDVVLSDGTRITGNYAHIQQLLSNHYGISLAFNTNEWYLSDSKGWVKISDMATPHIKNAIVKRYAEWVENLKVQGLDDFCDSLTNGPTDLAGLVAELATRDS